MSDGAKKSAKRLISLGDIASIYCININIGLFQYQYGINATWLF